MTRLSGITFCLLTTLIVHVNGKVFSECNGKPDGSYIRGQNGCSSFIFCKGEKSYESSCPPGLFFDVLTGMCDDPANVDCVAGPEAPMPICPASSSNEIIYVPSSESCAEYYVCRDGVPKTMHCVTNLHFNALTRQCDTPEAANCKIVIADQPPTVGTLKPTVVDPTTPPGTVTRTTTTITYFTSTTPAVPSSSTQPGPPTVTGTKPTTATPSSPTTTVFTTTPHFSSTASWPSTTTSTRTTTTPYFPSTTVTTTGTTWPPTTTVYTTTPHFSSTTSTRTTTTPYFPSTTVTTRGTTIGSTPIWTTPVPTTTISTRDLCKQVYAGYFAYPEDCHFYYRCAGGELTKHQCPNGFGWNANLKMCTAAGCSS